MVMMLNLYLPQPLIASDGSPGSVSSYAEGDTTPKWIIDITSDTVKKEGNKVIFEGSVSLIRDNTKIYADKVIMEVSDLPGRISRVEMIGKVWMTKPGILKIQCLRAQSDNFDLYIDLLEVTLTPGLVVNKARYWFDSGKLSYE